MIGYIRIGYRKDYTPAEVVFQLTIEILYFRRSSIVIGDIKIILPAEVVFRLTTDILYFRRK